MDVAMDGAGLRRAAPRKTGVWSSVAIVAASCLLVGLVGCGGSASPKSVAPPSSRTGVAADDSATTATSEAGCGPPSIGEDGTIEPLLCGDGTDNPAALAYHQGHNQRGFDLRVLNLEVTAGRQQVVATICSDLAPNSRMGLQTEQEAYQLATNRAGWKYDINVVTLRCG
jgi:hypothetical protein